MRGWLSWATTLLLASCAGPPTQVPAKASELPETQGWSYDPENARDIFETCAACHGRNGEGGKDGAYPRIAGLDERDIEDLLAYLSTRDD